MQSYVARLVGTPILCRVVGPKKVECMRKWPKPENTTQLRGLLGLYSFYRRFIEEYAEVAASLTDKLKKEAFFWDAIAYKFNGHTNKKEGRSS